MGTPSEMEVNSGEGRWCGVDKVVVVVRSCIHKMQDGEQVWVKNLKLSHCGLVSDALCKTAMGDSV